MSSSYSASRHSLAVLGTLLVFTGFITKSVTDWYDLTLIGDGPDDEFLVVIKRKKHSNGGASSMTAIQRECDSDPWSEECCNLYNNGTWIEAAPGVGGIWKNWTQQNAYHMHLWNTSVLHEGKICKALGTRQAWVPSTTITSSPSSLFFGDGDANCNNQSNTIRIAALFDADRFIDITQNKNILVVGDSLSQQHFGVLCEALKVHMIDCPERTSYCRFRGNVTVAHLRHNYGDEANFTNLQHDYPGYDDRQWLHFADTQIFKTADIVVFNFGQWYYEQENLGRATNHTPSTYIARMKKIFQKLDDWNNSNSNSSSSHDNNQKIFIWRETTASLNPTSQAILNGNREVRSILRAQKHRIPIIEHHSHNAPVKMHKDAIHFCEPAVPMAWNSVLLRILNDILLDP